MGFGRFGTQSSTRCAGIASANEFSRNQLFFLPPGLPPGRLPPGLGPLGRPEAGFRPPVLPLKPGPDFENPDGLAPKADFERPPEEGLPAPPGFGFHAGLPVDDGPERLLLGRAPPARGLPVLVVKGRERSPSARGGRPDPNSRAPMRLPGREPLGRSNDGRSKRGRSGLGRSCPVRSDLGRSEPAPSGLGLNWPGRLLPLRPPLGRSEPVPRNGGRPVAGRPAGGRVVLGREVDSGSGSTASICSLGGLDGLKSSRVGAASRGGPAWGLNGGRSEPGFFHGFFSKGRPLPERLRAVNPAAGRSSRGAADPNCAGRWSERGGRSPNLAGGRVARSSFFHAGRSAPN